MCGIVGFFSESEKVELSKLLNIVDFNRHRGHQDGIGFIDVEKNAHYRTTFTLDEILTSELNFARSIVKKKTGFVTFPEFDGESYEKMNDKFEKTANKIKSRTSKKIVLHHRAKSIGKVDIKNAHPFSTGNGMYVHNGTLDGFEALYSWFEHYYEFKPKGETDSEFLAALIEQHIEEGESYEDISNLLSKLFPGGYGVVVRTDAKTGETVIFKDWARTLFFYDNDDYTLFTSEPVPNIRNFKSVHEMIWGYHVIGTEYDSSVFEDLTKGVQSARDDWKFLAENNVIVLSGTSCDVCKTKKANVVRIPPKYHTKSKLVDTCFECMCRERGEAKCAISC